MYINTTMAEKKPDPASTPKPDAQYQKMFTLLKALEQKVNNLNREVELIKGEYIRKLSSMKKDMRNVNEEMIDNKSVVSKLDKKMGLIIQELKTFADKREFDVIQKYLEYVNPMKFVTQEQFDKLREEIKKDGRDAK